MGFVALLRWNAGAEKPAGPGGADLRLPALVGQQPYFSPAVSLERRQSGTHESVILAVGADPYPRDRIRRQCAECAIVVSDANAEAVRAALHPAEMERWMMWVAAP